MIGPREGEPRSTKSLRGRSATVDHHRPTDRLVFPSFFCRLPSFSLAAGFLCCLFHVVEGPPVSAPKATGYNAGWAAWRALARSVRAAVSQSNLQDCSVRGCAQLS